MKKIFAVIGDPIAHSLSPVMHNAAFRALDMNAEYIAVRVPPAELGEFSKQAREKLAGFNITVPHKHGILPYLDSISDQAEFSGSVNTVSITDGKLSGTSTDGVGLERAVMEAFQLPFKGLDICFLGCGGVVLALSCHCAAAGAGSIRILNRTVSKAEDLCVRLRTKYPSVHFESGDISDAETAKKYLASSALAVQCTSLGLKPDDPPPVDPALLPDSIALFETIYKPTKLICAARERGLRTCDGLPMLLHQGAESFRIWTGVMPDVEVMRQALLEVKQNHKE